MSHFSFVALALLMSACGPTTEHKSGTCSGSAGIQQVGSYNPSTSLDAGHSDTMKSIDDASSPGSDAGLSPTDTPTPLLSDDAGE